jgi:hypothetical protein
MKEKTNKGYRWVYDDQGNRVGVIISYTKFQKLIEKLEDLQDIYAARKVKGKKLKTVPLEKVLQEIASNGVRKQS